MEIIKKMLMVLVCVLVFETVMAFGIAYIAMLLWNIFCTYIGFGPIGYWQAWALFMLLGLIAIPFKTNIKPNN